jgi:hypothetical protein
VISYRAYGAVLASTLALPELPAAAAARPDLFFDMAGGGLAGGGWRWAARPADAGADWMSVAIRQDGYRLRFDGGGDFHVSRDGSHISADPASGPLDTIRHLLLDQVVPLTLAQRGHLVLHASAFEIGRGAVALAGPPGAGKSTLAASFGASGTCLLADDALLVEPGGHRWLARPAYPAVRVWPDVVPVDARRPPRVAPYTDKRRLGSAEGLAFTAAPSPLDRIYVLDYVESAETEIVPLSGRQAVMAIVAHTFSLDVSDRRRAVAQLDQALALSRQTPVCRLRYPRSLAALPSVRQAIQDHGLPS